jgi:hypothetical protein
MEDFTQETGKTRLLADLGNNKIYGKMTDPYGFIHLSFERGQLPNDLKSAAYTGWEYARQAVEKYLRESKRDTK